MLFGLVSLGLVRYTVLMVRRSINSIKLERIFGRRIDHIMLRTRGHNNGIAVAHTILVTVNKYLARSRFKTKKLVNRVYLFANLFARRETHQHKLAILCGVEYSPVICVFLCRLFDIREKTFHGCIKAQKRL